MANVRNLNMLLFFYLFVLLSCLSAARIRKTTILNARGLAQNYEDSTLYYTQTDFLAWSEHYQEYLETGWDIYTVYSNDKLSDAQQAYSAGYLEGLNLKEQIDNHWYNSRLTDYCKKPYTGFCKKLFNYLSANYEFMLEEIVNNNTQFWHQVHLQLSQIKGLEDGWSERKYNFTVLPKDIDLFGIYFLQVQGDLEDLVSALNDTNFRRSQVIGSGSCSAMIRLLPDNSDLYSAQDTWSGYESMTRVLKKYVFYFRETSHPNSPLIPGNQQSFSSYPGVISSGDDFYVLNTGLVTMETTNGNYNNKLWPIVQNGAKTSVFEFLRVQAANRLGTNGSSWIKVFSTYNSGTYNNQWMVVDYNKFNKGKVPVKNLLWIAEQLPGKVFTMDATKNLTKNGYWGSYNIPAIPDAYKLSGFPEMEAKYGSFFSHSECARARIFARDAPRVMNLTSAIAFMRQNRYQTDPLSRCKCEPPYSAENAISARSDLNPANGTYPIPALGHRSHGGTDMKITSSALIPNLNFKAQSGPTWSDQPPFNWKTADFSKITPHRGQPDLWKFPVIDTNFK